MELARKKSLGFGCGRLPRMQPRVHCDRHRIVTSSTSQESKHHAETCSGSQRRWRSCSTSVVFITSSQTQESTPKTSIEVEPKPGQEQVNASGTCRRVFEFGGSMDREAVRPDRCCRNQWKQMLTWMVLFLVPMMWCFARHWYAASHASWEDRFMYPR